MAQQNRWNHTQLPTRSLVGQANSWDDHPQWPRLDEKHLRFQNARDEGEVRKWDLWAQEEARAVAFGNGEATSEQVVSYREQVSKLNRKIEELGS